MKSVLCFISVLYFSASLAFAAQPVNYYVIAEQAQPFQIEDKANEHSGIVTDIVKAIFEQSEHEITYHTYPFNRMISVLEAGGEKNWITYGSPNWGSVQAENLSDIPIYTVKHAIVMSSMNPVNFVGMHSIANKGVVLLRGFDYAELQPYIDEGAVNEVRVKDYQAAFRVVKRTPGEMAFIEMESRVKYNLDKLGLDSAKFDIQPFSNVIADYPIYLAFSSEMDPELQAFINQRLTTLKEEGKLESIISKYI
ncbi:transporter substrate-binding domain-containing protein [Vibrio sp. ZSDE26]|uniref:Transporter substrate-binding domain-containing protein n=1 Tax=Vibrio amylolyticus TaxID=2847292 RepID=A0A9X1XH90_9VIBR|nr:transporter substrate-binding domain-containing protein [Vibrio amylolyticus]MCK6261723.1 transporter substrate-binding domain-containing protein [Vibrio amylolyticus]